MIITGGNTTHFFTGQAINFDHWMMIYFGVIFLIFGIVVGLGIIQTIISVCRWCKKRHQPNRSEDIQKRPITISNQDLEDTAKHIKELRQTFKDLGNFFKDLSGDKDDKPKE